MTEPATEIERATKNAEQMAQSLGARVFLYQDPMGHPVFRVIHPASPDEHLELIQTFEGPTERRIFDQSLPPTPSPPEAT